MARSNTARTRPAAQSPITTERVPSGQTALGAPGYGRDLRSELNLLAVSLFAGEDAFHEPAAARADRFQALVRRAAVTDAEWCAGFLKYLRGDANIRTAAIEAAAEFTKARLDAGLRGLSRQVVDAVLQRADEPAEMLAYWTSRYGRRIPKPLKRGVADACRRLFTERSLLKYDVPERAWRMADVLELVHARPRAAWQGAVFTYALHRRHGRGGVLPAGLPILRYRRELMSMAVPERRRWLVNAAAAGAVHERLRAAGMTWEAMAGWLQGPMDKAAWEAVIPAMPFMSRLRNLRNFDEAGVSDTVAQQVGAYLADPVEVGRSRQFPFRFLAAYRANAGSLRWAWPLEQALNHSLANIPGLPGRTLVLVDRSPSMWQVRMSEHSTMAWADGAAVFGAALALRAERADLVEFGDTHRPVPFTEPGLSVLTLVERFSRLNGTDIPSAVAAHLRPQHDRVVIITDEQTRPGHLPYYGRGQFGGWEHRHRSIDDLVPKHTPLYMFNFGGYERGAAPAGHTNRHCLAGLTDSAFRVIPMLEAGRDVDWPFEPMTCAA